MKNKQTAIILVGGLGKRLRPLTQITPKPLLKIGPNTILEIIINHLTKNGFRKIIFAARYKSEIFQKEMIKLKKKYKSTEFIVSVEKKRLGTCGPIKVCSDYLPENFLVINGDIITNVNLKKIFDSFVKKRNTFMVFVKKVYMPFEFGRLDIKKNKIVSVEEKPMIKNLIIGGIYILNKKCLEHIPKDKYFGMDQLIKLFLKKKHAIESHIMNHDLWLDIGNHTIYKKIKNLKSISKIKSE